MKIDCMEWTQLAHFEVSEEFERDAAILARLEDIASKPSLSESLMRWVSRTPIMGSLAGNDGDEDTKGIYRDSSKFT